MAGLHRKEGKTKYLVLRRDGTVPDWEWFVLGAKDPWAPAGMRAYAQAAEDGGADPQYVADVRAMASDFAVHRMNSGNGDPDAPLHGTDNPWVAAVLAGRATVAPGVAVVKVDVEGLHRVARDMLGMTNPAQAAAWVSARFQEVVDAVANMKSDDWVVDGGKSLQTVSVNGRDYDVNVLHVLSEKEAIDADAD